MDEKVTSVPKVPKQDFLGWCHPLSVLWGRDPRAVQAPSGDGSGTKATNSKSKPNGAISDRTTQTSLWKVNGQCFKQKDILGCFSFTCRQRNCGQQCLHDETKFMCQLLLQRSRMLSCIIASISNFISNLLNTPSIPKNSTFIYVTNMYWATNAYQAQF